jgi:outer membrane protein TolC
LREAVERARQYPSIQVQEQQAASAAAAIQLARTAYLPRVEVIAGVNRATRNNTFGLLLPSQIIAPISGPALNANSPAHVFGSTVGFLVTWEPFDFGQRRLQVEVAERSRDTASRAVARTQFDVAHYTADAYLTVIAAEETVQAARASLTRAQQVERITNALVAAELRPGAELSRAQAEVATAIQLVIHAEQAQEQARAALKQTAGAASLRAREAWTQRAPNIVWEKTDFATHPYAQQQSATIAEVEAREKVLARGYVPRFSVQGTTYARGEGQYDPARGPGNAGGVASGLGPNIANWAVGFTVNFNLTELASLRARREMELRKEKSERARYEQIVRELTAQLEKAESALMAAQRTASNVKVLVESARQGREQARARYEAGLSNLTELAEAERILTQAEIDAGLANLNIWRALLSIAAATGNLDKFLSLAP